MRIPGPLYTVIDVNRYKHCMMESEARQWQGNGKAMKKEVVRKLIIADSESRRVICVRMAIRVTISSRRETMSPYRFFYPFGTIAER